MATQLGKGHIYSLAGGTLACSLSGYVSPNLQTLRANHNADVIEIKGQDGNVNGVIANNDWVECTFDFIPQGSTIANSKLSAGTPAAGTGFTIANLPVITFAGIADVFNTDDWIYVGGNFELPSDRNAVGSITLRRYPGITSTTAIT